MTDKSRLVDPVHFFNSEGTSVLTLKHLLKQNQELSDENERLHRMLRAQIEKAKAIGASDPETERK